MSPLIFLTVFASLSPAVPPPIELRLRGDVVMVGSTLALDCAPGAVAPLVGSIISCGAPGTTADSAPDAYWGVFSAHSAISPKGAHTRAQLTLPPGAVVVSARLHWAASGGAPSPVYFLPESSAVQLAPDDTIVAGSGFVASVDVSDVVRTKGSGTYGVAEVDGPVLENVTDDEAFSAWWLVVVYAYSDLPMRRIHLHEVFESLGTLQRTFDGPPIKPGLGPIRVGFVTLEGDAGVGGDSVSVFGAAVSNANNPLGDAFNSSRTTDGVPSTAATDRPYLAGTPHSMAGLDLDVFDVTAAAPTPTTIRMACPTRAMAHRTSRVSGSVAMPRRTATISRMTTAVRT